MCPFLVEAKGILCRVRFCAQYCLRFKKYVLLFRIWALCVFRNDEYQSIA